MIKETGISSIECTLDSRVLFCCRLCFDKNFRDTVINFFDPKIPEIYIFLPTMIIDDTNFLYCHGQW